VKVARADNPSGTYVSMHHKFVVSDGQVAVLGVFNWYHDAAFKNEENQVVGQDPKLAADLRGSSSTCCAGMTRPSTRRSGPDHAFLRRVLCWNDVRTVVHDGHVSEVVVMKIVQP